MRCAWSLFFSHTRHHTTTTVTVVLVGINLTNFSGRSKTTQMASWPLCVRGKLAIKSIEILSHLLLRISKECKIPTTLSRSDFLTWHCKHWVMYLCTSVRILGEINVLEMRTSVCCIPGWPAGWPTDGASWYSWRIFCFTLSRYFACAWRNEAGPPGSWTEEQVLKGERERENARFTYEQRNTGTRPVDTEDANGHRDKETRMYVY